MTERKRESHVINFLQWLINNNKIKRNEGKGNEKKELMISTRDDMVW